MGQGYQDRDYEIVDYELWQLDRIHRPIRGPQPPLLEPGRYFVAAGAAQTFGCYTPLPFPAILQDELSLNALNFGVAGAGPTFFTARSDFMSYINDAKFAIVQVMSGRSESNSLYESAQGGEMLRRRSDGSRIAAQRAYEEMLRELPAEEVLRIVEETRSNWVRNNVRLLRMIEIPKILLWFSVRGLDYEMKTDSVFSLFGDFPQLVTSPMVEELRPLCDGYVECVSNRGMPQELISRFTGNPAPITMRQDLGGRKKTHNDYYPTPEMHEDAARLLTPACRELLGS